MPLVSAPTITQTAGGQNLFAVAGSSASGGVSQLLAGANVTLSPPDGLGVVTVSAASPGASGVTSVTASGAGITATPTTGAVVVANTGVTSLVAGSGIGLSSGSGAVTVSAIPGPYTTGSLTVSGPLTAQGQVNFTNVFGTYAAPILLTSSSSPSPPTDITGASGVVQIPFSSVQGTRWFFSAKVNLRSATSSVMLVTPTGESNSFFGDRLLLNDPTVIVRVNYQNTGITVIEGYSNIAGISDPTNRSMEVYFVQINQV
jgi:hypothetical protein